MRLARPIPYPPEQVRSVTLLHDAGRLWLSVTAADPVQQHDLDSGRVAGVDLGIIHPHAATTQDVGLLVSGRAVRADSYLHLHDQQARQARAAGRAPRRGQRGSRRWRRHRARLRRVEARHRRRVHQAHHQAAKLVVAFAVAHKVGTLVVGDPTGRAGPLTVRRMVAAQAGREPAGCNPECNPAGRDGSVHKSDSLGRHPPDTQAEQDGK